MKKIRPEIFSSYRFGELVDEYVQGDVNKQILILFYVDDLTQEEIVEKLQNAMAATVRFTIPEGYTIKQIGEKLANDGLVSSPEEFYEACEGEFVYTARFE